MQRRWIRRLSLQLVVALCSLAVVVTALFVPQGDPRPEAVAVAMLSGGAAAMLPDVDLAPATTETASEAPSPTVPSPSTTATGAERAAETAVDATGAAKPRPDPCPTTTAPDDPCGPPCPHPGQGTRPAKCPPPPCPQPGSANSATACPPPCAQPGAAPTGNSPVAFNGTHAEPARPACPPSPPPACRQYDIRTGSTKPCPPACSLDGTAGNSSSQCPQPCPALATADGRPAPCPPPPCPQPRYDDGATRPASACPPPPPPPCERDASCPPPCYQAQPAPASTAAAEPVPPSEPCPPPCQGAKACPPPCPSAATTDPSCTPPCSSESAAGERAAGAFAPCPAPSGVTGRITAGPACPVERSDEPCPDKPVETTVRLLRQDGSVAARAKSSADGSFRMTAAPGRYRLVADWPSRMGGCGPIEVTVEYGRFTSTEVSCDTGIR